MRDLTDILKMRPILERDISYQLTVYYILSQKNEDEYILCDKTSGWNSESGIASEYSAFWYSHICGGGAYYHLLSIYVPAMPGNIEIIPARNYGLNNRTFQLHDPNATELKTFIRQILDVIKKAQGRHPW